MDKVSIKDETKEQKIIYERSLNFKILCEGKQKAIHNPKVQFQIYKKLTKPKREKKGRKSVFQQQAQ